MAKKKHLHFFADAFITNKYTFYHLTSIDHNIHGDKLEKISVIHL